MLEIGTIYQIDNGFLLVLSPEPNEPKTTLYCKDHKEIAETLISKRVAEKLRGYPVQQELKFDTNDQPFI